MSLSIAPIRNLSMTSIQPLSFQVRNQADISDAYTDSVKKADNSTLVNPVSYPTARKETLEVPELKQKQEATEVNRAFNNIAAQFGNSNIGYSYTGTGAVYEMAGSMFDALA